MNRTQLTMPPLLNPVRPDLSTDYWTVPGINTDTVIVANGCRRHVEHEQRVLRARLMRDLDRVAVAAPPITATKERMP